MERTSLVYLMIHRALVARVNCFRANIDTIRLLYGSYCERILNSVQERLCGSLTTHTELWILCLFFEFCTHPDAYLSKFAKNDLPTRRVGLVRQMTRLFGPRNRCIAHVCVRVCVYIYNHAQTCIVQQCHIYGWVISHTSTLWTEHLDDLRW